MDNFVINIVSKISNIDNTSLFALSIIPYSIFLYYLYKIKTINNIIKIGFTLTILFVFITIIFSLLSQYIYDKSLVEVDLFHGFAESFLTISDFVILYGFIKVIDMKEVNKS